MLNHLMRKKAIDGDEELALHRTLSTLDLIFMGIGATIGAGVFVLTGIAAATQAGPAVILSYLIAGIASLFAALSYAELAASIGGTGSAYSYAYAGFGEFIAWILGWNLLLEYFMAVATVSIGWSGYVDNLFEAIGLPLPISISKNIFEGGIINLPAMLVVLAMTLILCLGVKKSTKFNFVIVIIKLLTIFTFIFFAAFHVNTNNWSNFLPFGWHGVMSGASLVFFAYIGFDTLSTAAGETITPARSIPIAILTSLIICTFIYIAVAGLLTLIVPYYLLNVGSPVAYALLRIGHAHVAGLIAIGAIAGLTTAILMFYYGLTRICYAMACDGLLPQSLKYVHPETRTPIRIILLTGIMIALVAGFLPIHWVAELVNIGTLAAFVFVCGGVMVFRHTHPDLPRPFKLPFSPIIPLLGMFTCFYLMLQLAGVTWWRFVIWTAIGVLIYFIYGRSHSLLNK